MACAQPSVTPNPDAMKFTLDVPLPRPVQGPAASAPGTDRAGQEDGGDTVDRFVAAVLGVEGVLAVFGVNDFVTVTRRPGTEWEPIISAVGEAARRHLPDAPGAPGPDRVAAARELLREAISRPAPVSVDIGRRRKPAG